MFARISKLFFKSTHKHREYTLEDSGLSRAQIDVGRKALSILGLEDPNQLTKHDVILFLYAVGLNPTDDVIDSKFRLLELHNTNSLTFPQLCHIWHSMLQDLSDEDEILRRAFQFFDKDGNGEISVAELRNTMKELGNLLTEQEIVSFMECMDVNNDGVIGYHEFIDTLRTQAPPVIGQEEDFFGDSREMTSEGAPTAEAAESPATRSHGQRYNRHSPSDVNGQPGEHSRQGVVSSGGAGITPRTAHNLITSASVSRSADVEAGPLPGLVVNK